MKTYNHLYPQIASFANLDEAWRKARRGKRTKEAAARFEQNAEGELFQLERELLAHTYRPGPYRTFIIYDPKQRKISAAPFRDRVVHHALCNVIEPIYERKFIHDSYANRLGKGTHRALDRAQTFARRYRYVFKADVETFFPAIDHDVLKAILWRHIACDDTRWLMTQTAGASWPTSTGSAGSPATTCWQRCARAGCLSVTRRRSSGPTST